MDINAELDALRNYEAYSRCLLRRTKKNDARSSTRTAGIPPQISNGLLPIMSRESNQYILRASEGTLKQHILKAYGENEGNAPDIFILGTSSGSPSHLSHS
jgi:hypothetical protein